MKVISFFYKRPVAVTMVFLAMLILGIVSIFEIPVTMLPEIPIGKITVKVDAPGYSSRKLEDDVIKNLKFQLMQLNYASSIESETRNNSGVIELYFPFGTDMEMAFIETNEQVDRYLPSLPKDIQRPKVMHTTANDIPLFYLNIWTSSINPETFSELNVYVKNVISRRLEQLPGIAFVDLSGLIETEIKITKDTSKFVSLGLNDQDLELVLKKSLIENKTFTLEKNSQEFKLLLQSPVQNFKDLKEIVLSKDGKILTLGEICKIEKSIKSPEGYCLLNGSPAISLAIISQPGSRIGKVKSDVRKLLTQIHNEYPDIKYEIVNDQGLLLNSTLNNLLQSLIVGFILALVIVYVFIPNRALALLIGISIPISLLISIFFFNLVNMTINIISLSGLILGIGMMIDNAIIVIDNISQKYFESENIFKSVVIGTTEIFQPLLSSVLTTTCIFIPLVFLSGISGALFKDQAIAIAIGLSVSLLISIVLLPVYFKIIKPKFKSGNSIVNRWFHDVYEKAFRRLNRKPITVVVLSVLFIITGFVGLGIINREEMPEITRLTNSIYIDWNEQITCNENNRRIRSLHKELEPNALNVLSWIGKQQFILNHIKEQGVKESRTFIAFASKHDQEKGLKQLNEFVSERYPNAIIKNEIVANIFDFVFSDSEPDLTLKLYYQNKFDAQPQKVRKIIKRLDSLAFPEKRTELAVQSIVGYRIDPVRLQMLDIDYSSAVAEIQNFFQPYKLGEISDGNEINDIVISSQQHISGFWQNGFILKNKNGENYSIEKLGIQTNIEEWEVIFADQNGEYIPFEIPVLVNNNFPIEKTRSVISGYDGWSLVAEGAIYNKQKQLIEMVVVFIISVLLLYFILAAQFESLLQPLIILIEIPIDLAGIFILLFVFDDSLNIISLIGIVVMTGIVINDSILKIDTINRLIKSGYTIDNAIHYAGVIRLRPILMTTLTTILALIPYLFGSGIGNEIQRPMALVIIGGLFLGTIVSSLFVPFYYKGLYVFLNRKRNEK